MLVFATDDCTDPSRFVGSLKEKVLKRDINSGILENSGSLQCAAAKTRLPLAESHWHTDCFLRSELNSVSSPLTTEREAETARRDILIPSLDGRGLVCAAGIKESSLCTLNYLLPFPCFWRVSNLPTSLSPKYKLFVWDYFDAKFSLPPGLFTQQQVFFFVYHLSLFRNRINSHQKKSVSLPLNIVVLKLA